MTHDQDAYGKFSDPSMTLEGYVRHLLGLGKKSEHEEFQTLFRVYGEKKIRGIASRILREGRDRDENASQTHTVAPGSTNAVPEPRSEG